MTNRVTFDGLTPPYATIVADPPWPYETQPMGFQRDGGKRSFLPYSSMTLDDLATLDVAGLAALDAHLFLWTTNSFLWSARDLADRWGFDVGQVLVWCKEPMGAPSGSFMPTTEFVLVCRRRYGEAIKAARVAAGLSVTEMQRAVRGNATGLASMWEKSIRYPSDEDWTALSDVLGVQFGMRAGNLRAGTTSTWWQWKRGAHSEKPAAFLDLVESIAPDPYVELFARAQRLGWVSWGYGYEKEAVNG